MHATRRCSWAVSGLGCTFSRGQGKIFYFRPGHETFPTYYNPQILQVISNGIRWAEPSRAATPVRGNHKPLEPIAAKS